MTPMILDIARMAGLLLALLAVAAILMWGERRFLGLVQDRLGPNRVGPAGSLQSVADGLKLLFKEDWVPPFGDRLIFVAAPALLMTTVLLSFAFVPWGTWGIADIDVGLLGVLGLSSLGVYAAAFAGWSSGNRYALLGGVRAAAQMVSYELTLGLSLAGVVMLAGSFRLGDIVDAQSHVPFVVLQPLGFALFVIASAAESRRLPFDLPEAENELVAGYHTEYSGMKFALFFLAEYAAVVLLSLLGATFFLGGWRGPWLPGPIWLSIKAAPFVLLFFWMRASLPRPRFDQLMAAGWKVLLPLALANLLVTGGVALLVPEGGG